MAKKVPNKSYESFDTPPESEMDIIEEFDRPEPATLLLEKIEIPLGTARLQQGYRPKHCEVQLTEDQAINLRRLWLALDQRGDRLANGRRVGSHADTIRWLLEQIPPEPPLPTSEVG